MYRRKNSWKELGTFFVFVFLIWSWFAILAYGQDTLRVGGSVVVDSTTATFDLSVDRIIVTDTLIYEVYDTTFVSDTSFVTVYDTTFVTDTTNTIVYNDRSALKDVSIGVGRELDNNFHTVTITGSSSGDSVRVWVSPDSIGVDSLFVPDSLFSLSFDTDYLGVLHYNASGWSGEYNVNYSSSIDLALIDTLGGTPSIADSMALPSSGYSTADWTNPSSDLTDFVGIVDLSNMPADFWTAVSSSDGTKGRVAKDSGPTELASEWVDFDDVAETGFVFFKWSGTLSSTGTQTVRIYPPQSGNSSYLVTDTFGRNAVWTSFTAVYHLNQDPSGTAPQMIDATGNGNDMTSNGSMTSGDLVTGLIDQALDFDGSDDYLGVANPITLSSAWSVYGYANPDAIGDFNAFYGFVDSGGAEWLMLNQENANDLKMGSSGETPGTGSAVADGVWHQIGMQYGGSGDIQSILNGAFDYATTPSGSGWQTSDVLRIGENTAAPDPSNGQIDEVRYAQSEFTADYYALDDSNFTDPTTFWGTWTWNAASGTTTLNGNDISHTTSLAQGAFQTITLSGNGLEHTNQLDQGSIPITLSMNGLVHTVLMDQTNIPITLSGNELQHPTSLDQSSITIEVIPNELSHSTTIDQTTVSGFGVLQPNSLESSQQLDQSSITILLSTNDISNTTALEGATLQVTVRPSDLEHTVSLDQGFFQAIELTPDELSHSVDLQTANLIIEGDATKVNLVAEELYEITLSAEKIYRMVLKSDKQYTILTETNEVIE